MELWINGSSYKYLIPRPECDFYYEHKPFYTTLWITGITYEWLLTNGYIKRF